MCQTPASQAITGWAKFRSEALFALSLCPDGRVLSKPIGCGSSWLEIGSWWQLVCWKVGWAAVPDPSNSGKKDQERILQLKKQCKAGLISGFNIVGNKDLFLLFCCLWASTALFLKQSSTIGPISEHSRINLTGGFVYLVPVQGQVITNVHKPSVAFQCNNSYLQSHTKCPSFVTAVIATAMCKCTQKKCWQMVHWWEILCHSTVGLFFKLKSGK